MDKPPITPTPIAPLPPPQPIASTTPGLSIKKKFLSKKVLLWSGLGLVVLLIGLAAGTWFWYQSQLASVGTDKDVYIKVTIEPDTTPASIGQLLQDKKIIRNTQAFGFYTRLTGTQNKLQAGTYRLSPSQTTPEIVDHLTNGTVDTFNLTFLPGATLAQNRKVLIAAGYTEAEVDAGLNAQYESPLFATKPATADLEGYIYGETYNFGSGATVPEILTHIFEYYNGIIVDNGLVAKYKTHGLTLYQGITLASIVQRESGGSDKAEIAQIFYSRLALGMPLGSDVTYQYIADKTGVARDPNLNSPYNTRRFAGLPPGPIAVPGLAALKAVADPASTDYLYFLSGDDNVTYYARTNAEHEANIVDHCKVKCSTL